MSRRRVLLVGHGRIGQAVFEEWRPLLEDLRLMVVDPLVEIPEGYAWDGRSADVAVIMVDTPADSRLSGRFDYQALVVALYQSLDVARWVVVRSTVALDFLDLDVYLADADRIGFMPEFYGTTAHSRRGAIDLPFLILSERVPGWFADEVAAGRKLLVAPAPEVIVAKLAENAYLATKVTFFHELSVACRDRGLSFDTVRELVTSDPRIGPAHSFVDNGLGWSSHCLDKDVPAYCRVGNMDLVEAVRNVNRWLQMADPL